MIDRTRRPPARTRAPRAACSIVRVNRLLLVCALLAGARLAAAQPAPPAPLPKVSKDQARQARARAEALCAAREPGCDWLATRGGLERQTVLRALTARGYTLDPSPWDKVVGKVHIYN